MADLLTPKELKEQGSIVELLSRLGYQPVPKRGRERMYHSMLRNNDSTPSFAVNDDLGVWFDHGLGKGGNIIDFGMAYWKQLSFAEVVRKIQEVCMLAPVEQSKPRPRRISKSPRHIVEMVKKLGTHPAITDYLKSRGIFDVARKHLSEVYYFVEDDNNVRKRYFAAGWQNDKGSWEVRNRYFKGCIGYKSITLIKGNEKKVAVFEGFLDFLSWRSEHPDAEHSVIVLNTLSLLQQAINRAKDFSSVDIYFDWDKAGVAATKDFMRSLPYATDRSKLYQGFNDYNDMIRSRVNQPEPAQPLEDSAIEKLRAHFGR